MPEACFQHDIARAFRQTEALAPAGEVAVPGAVEAVELLGPAVKFQLARVEIGRPEAHGAADVVARERRVKHPLAHERCADGHTLAGMQVRKAGGEPDAGEFCCGVKLGESGALDPGFVRRKKADVGGFSQ
jgi:hypothetical protein